MNIFYSFITWFTDCLINIFYRFVTWFTDCPYFNFATGICSIASTVALINFFYFHKPSTMKNKNKISELIDMLIDITSKNSCLIASIESSDLDGLSDLKGQHIDYQHSFQIFISSKSSGFFIIKTHNDTRLYGTFDVIKTPYRLITTSSNNHKLDKLLQNCSFGTDVSDENFLEKIITTLKKI